MVNHLKYIIVILLSVFIFSCKTSKRITAPRNLEQIYDVTRSSIHPEIKVYNNSDTSSIIILKLYAKELLFNQANPEKILQAEVEIIYNLYDLNNKQILVDSSTTVFKHEKNTEAPYYTYTISVKTEKGKKYFLEIITTDIKRNGTHYSFLRIDRNKNYNELDFLVFSKKSKSLKINSFVSNTEQFEISHYKEDLDSLIVFYYSNNFYTPPPPYLLDTTNNDFENIDTSWVCYLDSIKYDNFQGEGVYFFNKWLEIKEDYFADTNGFALYNFGKKFPIVRTPSDLLKPIIYLDTININTDADSVGKFTKLAVDDFWLDRANNIDKSRELLKKYYNRVMFANKYFTSYKEGWQTDRGMIYTIYGIPDYINKSGIEERWIYNAHGIGAGITFTFNYSETPFSINHFVLDREKLKYTGWDEAIEMWNKGEVFYFQK
jgi:GWxTD domain-containing protein